MRILVVEDEPRMMELLRRGLQEHGCAVMTARDGETGLEIASRCDFDAIVLDIGLPRRDGFEVMKELRHRCCTSRVLMLTARDGEENIIRGLELGADDYLTKPFSFPEFVARLQSITREPRRGLNQTLQASDLSIDPVRRLVRRGSEKIELSRSEFSLLLSLVRNRGRCVPRLSLIECVWGADSEVGSGALDVLVNSLRTKINALNRPKLIHTVRGCGYVLGDAWQHPERAKP